MDDPIYAKATPSELRYMVDILDQLRNTDLSDPDVATTTMFNYSQQLNSRFSPLKQLPCAGAQSQASETSVGCEKPGILACGACKLVSYCSKACSIAVTTRRGAPITSPFRIVKTPIGKTIRNVRRLISLPERRHVS